MEPYLNISLPLAKEMYLKHLNNDENLTDGGSTDQEAKLNLFSCLKHFTIPEALIDQVYCEECGMKTPTLKQHTFATLPQVLCLHLKRFNFLTKKKIIEPVVFPESLNMGSYLPGWCEVIQGDSLSDVSPSRLRDDASVANSSPVSMYDLFATIDHTGTLNQGHYLSNVKIKDKWYTCNDSFVSHIDKAFVLQSENAYMLFYSRRKIKI